LIRKFGLTAAAVLAAAVLLAGCSSTSLPVYRYDNRGGQIDLYLRWYPELLTTGGVIELLVDGGKRSIYVARISFSRFAVLSPACSLDECALKFEKNGFRCPCDGSRFDLDGTPLSGPADKPLAAFDSQYLESTLRIFLR